MNGEFRKELLCSLCLLAFVAESSQGRFLTEKQARKRPRGRIACVASATLVRATRTLLPWAAMPIVKVSSTALRPAGAQRHRVHLRGGFIDVTHTRKLTDWTAYLAYSIRAAIRANYKDFSFKMREPSRFYVRIEYPRTGTNCRRVQETPWLLRSRLSWRRTFPLRRVPGMKCSRGSGIKPSASTRSSTPPFPGRTAIRTRSAAGSRKSLCAIPTRNSSGR